MEIEHTELNILEWSQARKDIALGRLKEATWEKASPKQRGILHQIELTIKSLTETDLTKIL